MKSWRVSIVESTRVEAIVLAENKAGAWEKARRGDYDKLLETAIPISDKIESVQEVK